MFIILSLIVLVLPPSTSSRPFMIVMEKNKDYRDFEIHGATSQSIMKIFIYQV
jgi:ABC-type lipoprotein release transport system permease subunit